jgi:hypothetical protein
LLIVDCTFLSNHDLVRDTLLTPSLWWLAEKTQEELSKQNQDEITTVLSFFISKVPRPEDESDELDTQAAVSALVDALWDKLRCLKDWTALVEFLLAPEVNKKATKRRASQAQAKDEESQTVMAYLLNACVQKATTPKPGTKVNQAQKVSAGVRFCFRKLNFTFTLFLSFFYLP